MPGGWQTYRCERCPLVLEVGGSTWWDEAGVVYSETIQCACGKCGTLHRITDERGTCRVTALAGPLRVPRLVTIQEISGELQEIEEWLTETDWQLVGPFPAGLEAREQLPCHFCGCIGFLGKVRPETCPVCLGPMECIGITDAI